MKTITSCLLSLLLTITAVSCGTKNVTADYNVIPLPDKITLSGENEKFKLTGSTVIAYPAGNDTLLKEAAHLQEYLRHLTGHELKIKEQPVTGSVINLNISPIVDNAEGYRLTVSPEKIDIEGSTAAGVFYGIQTLRKSIPAVNEGKVDVEFPAAVITDYPRFAYRGFHFDVSRHFFPQDSVKKLIDLLAMHNINKLHWHLTDDQGWRVEIKKYPRLTEVGSKRPGTVIGHNTPENDTIPVEGYYTQDQIREIVEYAANRHIAVIPEIDLPGHMIAALTAYPNLGCTGGPYEVWQRWGVSEDLLCAGNDSVYMFLDDVLGEISDLFPAEYVHIGGDECPKIRWEECEKCQAKIKELGLKSDGVVSAEEKLQGYIMRHAEDFLASKGKKIIGWDEIVECGASPDATVMSWRGEVGGMQAARNGNDVVMTPNTYLYFDYYQTTDVENEPIAIGGYIPLERVYEYEPVPSTFSPEEAAHIKGVQANLWAEYLKTFPKAVYMALPRMAALSEVQWTQGDKDYEGFLKRLATMLPHYDLDDFTYSLRAYDITGNVAIDSIDNSLIYTLSTPIESSIYYTLDGTEPTVSSNRYTEPLKISGDTKLKAVAMYGFGPGYVYSDSVAINKATAKVVKLLTEPSPQYARDPKMLIDGRNGDNNWGSHRWVGFHGNDAVAVIDLMQQEEISRLNAGIMVDTGSYIFDLRNLSLAVSADGNNWIDIASEDYPAMESEAKERVEHTLEFPPVETRYVKITLKPEKAMPAWHEAPGEPAFIFIDELSLQ